MVAATPPIVAEAIVPAVPAFLVPIPTMIYLSAAASPNGCVVNENVVAALVVDALPK
jgi:hypothetical protein